MLLREVNESMQNMMLVKASSAEDFEKTKYNSLMTKYMNSYSDSQNVLANLNLGIASFMKARRSPPPLACPFRSFFRALMC